jgi:hypothetical protein
MTQSRKTTDSQAPASLARRNWAGAIASDVRVAASEALLRAGFSDPTILLHWDEVAGAETARLASPVRFTEGASGGVLTLKAEPGAALFLHHDTRALTARINAYLGREAVTRLRFIQGPVLRRPPPPPKRAAPLPPPASDPANRYKGPDSVRDALLKLARARQRPLQP